MGAHIINRGAREPFVYSARSPIGSSAPLSRWSCLGFEVRSRLSFRLLREAEGRPLEVVDFDGAEPDVLGDPLMSWEARPGNPFARRIYRREGGGFAIWHDAMGWFLVDEERPSIAVPPSEDELRREERIWGLPAAVCIDAGDDLALHGATVDVGGSAVVFCAPGGHGKTTLAAAFLRAGHRVLADDMSCCQLAPEPSVLPGPAILRIRNDVYSQLQLAGAEPVLRDDEKVHLMLTADARGSGVPVRLRAIVFVRDTSLRAIEGHPAISEVAAADSLANLWSVTFTLPTAQARQRTFEKVAALAGRAPIFEMYRPASYDDLSEAVDLVISTCIGDG
jgi:hypothetical protein